MIKLMYIRKRGALLDDFLKRQIKEADLSEVTLTNHYLDESNYLEKYDLHGYYNLVLLDENDQFIHAICQPFSSEDIELTIRFGKMLILTMED